MLDSRIKLALNVLGLLISLAGLVVFYHGQHYAIFIVLLLVTIGIASIMAIHALTPPISYKKLHWHVEIKDPQGKEARARKEQVLIANHRNITSLVDRHLSASGDLEPLNCNLGDIHGPIEEDGSATAYILLKTPLPIGRIVSKILCLRLKDSFTREKEVVSCIADHRYKELGLHVILPEVRKARSVNAYMFLDGKEEKLSAAEIADDGQLIQLVVDKPRMGAKYVLEWNW